MIRLPTAVLLALFLSSPITVAQSLPEGLAMHRKAAGTLDASGWTTAKSTDGAFSVRLPLKFNDFTMEMPTSNAKVARLFGIGGKTIEGIKFAAQRIAYRRVKLARDYFARLESGEAFRARGGTVKSFRFGDRAAVEVTLENSRSIGHLRYVLLKDSLIFLIVEIPQERKAEVAKKTVRTFLDSLTVSPL